MDFLSALAVDYPDDSARKAEILATLRASARFGAFLNEATTKQEFENRWGHIEDAVTRVASDAAIEVESNVVPDLKPILLKRADVLPQDQSPVTMPPPPDDLVLHQDADPEAQEKLRRFYQLINGQIPPSLEDQMQPDYYDMNQVDMMQGRRSSEEKDDEHPSDRKAKDPKDQPCPTCRANAGEDCKRMNEFDPVGKKQKYHDNRKKGQGEGGHPVMQLMGSFHEFLTAEVKEAEHIGWEAMVKKLMDQGHSRQSAEAIAGSIAKNKYGPNMHRGAEDGDSYERETVDLDAEKMTNSEPEPEPKMDTSKIPEEGLTPIEVPSVRNPVEQQSILDVPDWGEGNRERGWNDQTTERINPQDGIGEEQRGVGGVFPNRNQTEPVKAAKTAEFAQDVDNPQGTPYGPEEDHPGFAAIRALEGRGFSQQDAINFVNRYLENRPQPPQEDPYGMSQGLDQEDLRSMHTVSKTAKWRVLV
jgi:hypothetical protein